MRRKGTGPTCEGISVCWMGAPSVMLETAVPVLRSSQYERVMDPDPGDAVDRTELQTLTL